MSQQPIPGTPVVPAQAVAAPVVAQAAAGPVVAMPAPAVAMPAAAVPAAAPAAMARPANAAPPSNPQQQPVPEDDHESIDWATLIPSTLVSTVVHIILFLTLILIPQAEKPEQVATTIVSAPQEEPTELEDFKTEELPKVENADNQEITTDAENILENADSSVELPEMNDFSVAAEFSNDTAATTSDFLAESGDFAAIPGPPGNKGSGNSLTGRTSARKGAAKAGGSDNSEAAVEAALRWIVSVQNPKDGGWNFDMKNTFPAVTENGTAGNARNGATAMALLPLLAAGHTHKEGKYSKNVYRGLEFLMANTNKTYTKGNDVSWFEGEGTMYSHGLAAMAMCEAYGMTKDKSLMAYAQGGMNFINTAQDPAKGGWRYAVKQPGDTSVVGWQLMALKSGNMAYLTVNPNTIKLATVFLDSVSDEKDYRAYYGYSNPGKGPATTAIGLLCRMHLGWKRDRQGLQEGVAYLSKMGPSKTNFYFNYYATQVLFQWGGEEFDKWNKVMREDLISKQVKKKGANEGSWHPRDWEPRANDHSIERGGRLYATSLGTMILEVYYRHSRVMVKGATDEGFPL